MDKTPHTIKKLREENTLLRLAIKEIVKLTKEKPYSHNEDIFDISARFGIHENLIK